MDMIPIYQPIIAKNQKIYVNECLDSNWISSKGKYIDLFEKQLANYLNIKHALSVCNGTVSLSLILAALDIGYGNEILVPSLTYIAPISAIYWAGATPLLLQSDEYLQLVIEPAYLKKFLSKNTKAIIVPELYGNSPDIIKLHNFCLQNNLYLIEDSAESFGCKINDQYLGTFGDVGSFSFFANKIITGGELGAVVTNNTKLYEKMKSLKFQNHIGNFEHTGPGFNFKSTNIQCAIALAQLEEIETILSRKRDIADYYRGYLDRRFFALLPSVDISNEWMPLFFLPKNCRYQEFNAYMLNNNIETRPCFKYAHNMKEWRQLVKLDKDLLESENIEAFNLPCYPDLTEDQLQYIIKITNNYLITKK